MQTQVLVASQSPPWPNGNLPEVKLAVGWLVPDVDQKNRKKPSCSTCIIAHELCTYHKRKPHATVDELEDALQRLQYEYARLKATRRRAKPRESSTQSAYGASASRYEEFRLGEAVDRDLNASQSQCARDSMLASIMSKPADGLNQEPFVDESFLTMPTRVPPSGALTSSSINLQPSPGEGAAWSPASSQHPIRVFTPVGHFDSPGATGLVTSATIYPNQFAVSASPVNAVTFEVISPKYRESHSPTDNTYTKNHIASSPISCRPQPTGMHSHEPNQLQLGLGDKSREDSDSASQSAFAHRKKSIFSASPNTDDIVREPSLSFSRATWWDCLLQTYTVRRNPSQWSSEVTITTHRQAAAQEISQDVRSFFKVATIWLHFIHVPLFFDMFHHPEYRASIQPALILGVLAYSKLLQSSRYKIRDGQDAEERDKIWEQSVLLRGLAQSAFDASYNAGWIDIQLAQAAWVREHRLEETTHPSDPAQVLLWSNMTGSGGNDDAEDHRDEDVDFAMRVWMETLALEDALDAHTCKTEESTYWQVRLLHTLVPALKNDSSELSYWIQARDYLFS
ncbi:hypothetical protein FRB96_008331 [Tulasnella sp. 330]|nr:hypothetical protein FRB96_008331 [Tulasnella sp. 330]